MITNLNKYLIILMLINCQKPKEKRLFVDNGKLHCMFSDMMRWCIFNNRISGNSSFYSSFHMAARAGVKSIALHHAASCPKCMAL